MSAVADRALLIARPMAMSHPSVRVPFLGGLWVVINVGLGGLGIHFNWPVTCAFLAGLINGTLLAVVAVAMASERLQAGATGLLSGLSLSALRSDGSMMWKAMESLHSFVDNAFRGMGIDLDERLHRAIEQETLYMVWTIVFVVMASLVAEWVLSSRRKETTAESSEQ